MIDLSDEALPKWDGVNLSIAPPAAERTAYRQLPIKTEVVNSNSWKAGWAVGEARLLLNTKSRSRT